MNDDDDDRWPPDRGWSRVGLVLLGMLFLGAAVAAVAYNVAVVRIVLGG